MIYKVITSVLVGGGDRSHDDEWLFDTREEAQEFVNQFYKAFPKDIRDMDNPYIYTSRWKSEIEEINDTRADPYTWLNKKIKEKEEREKRHKERMSRRREEK